MLKTAFIYGEWYHNYDTFITYKFISAGRKIVYVNNMSIQTFLKSIEDHQVKQVKFRLCNFEIYLKYLTLQSDV